METAGKNQHHYQPIRAIIGEVPKSVGEHDKDIENLRRYIHRMLEVIEYNFEHLTLAQFADGEIGKIGGK